MKIYNFNTAVYSKNKNTYSTPIKPNSPISFSAISTDQKIANAYYKEFQNLLYKKNDVSKDDYKKLTR